jgi:hypothetical protein
MHSLTVGHNKLGDLEYAQGNLPAAQAGYKHALGIRQRAFHEQKASGEITLHGALQIAVPRVAMVLTVLAVHVWPGDGEGRPDLALSLVTSLLKSADIDEVPLAEEWCMHAPHAGMLRILSMPNLAQAMGDSAAAAAGFEEARRLLKDVAGSVAPGSADDKKQQALQQFLDARLGSTAT